MVRTQVFDSNIGRSFAVIIDRKKPLSELLNKKELNKIWKIFFFFALQKNKSSAFSSHQNESKSERVSVKSYSLKPHGLHARLLRPWNSPGKSTGGGCHSFLQGIVLTQGSNLGLPHGRQILYHLSHQGIEVA